MSEKTRKATPAPILNLFDTFHGLNAENYNEYYHDAVLAREEVASLFNLGYCSLEQRGLG